MFHPARNLVDICLLETRQTNQYEVVFGDVPAIFVRQVGLQLQAEKDVAKNIQPRAMGWFLVQHHAIPFRTCYGFSIGAHTAVVRLFQSSNDVQHCRFATATRTDQANEFAFIHLQIHVIKRKHFSSGSLKSFRNVLDGEFARRDKLQLLRDRTGPVAKHQGDSSSFEVSVEPLRNPASFPSWTAFAISSGDTSVVNLMRCQACATASGAKSDLVSAFSSSMSSFCASSGCA